jgi:hypothetical protein
MQMKRSRNGLVSWADYSTYSHLDHPEHDHELVNRLSVSQSGNTVTGEREMYSKSQHVECADASVLNVVARESED